MLQKGRSRMPPSSRFQPQNVPEAGNMQSVLKMIAQSRTTGRLNLSNQSLIKLPSALFAREDVREKVNVSFDSHGGWWEECDLTKLIIADNELDELDERIENFGGLTSIDAHNNKLTSLPDLSALQCLTILQLSGNLFSNLPESICFLPLAELHIAHNSLTSLPPAFSNLAPHLIILDVSNNQLESLPCSIASFPRLTRLNAPTNKLTDMLPAMHTPMLTHLNISNNRLSCLGDLSRCPSLQELNASQNALTQLFPSGTGINGVITLPSLIVFDVRVNRLTSLGSGGSTVKVSAPALKDLLVSSNQLSSLVDCTLVTGSVKSLETLDLKDNNFENVPEVVVEMSGLKRLLLEGNPIRVPRRAVIEKGTNAVLQWMRERVAA